MNALWQPVHNYVGRLWTVLSQGWNDFWFRPSDATTLAGIRICAALVLLYVHATCTPYVLDLIGPKGWIDEPAHIQLRDTEALAVRVPEQMRPAVRESSHWTPFTIWMWIQNPTAIKVLHAVFLAGLVCFLFGFCSRTASIIAWVGHVSYINRGFNIWFGMDTILLMITLYLMFAPTGTALSIDRLIQRYRQARQGLRTRDRALADLPVGPSWGANVIIRMIQVHMCIIYTISGIAKLQGVSWWSGGAGWQTIMIPEFRLFDLSFLAWLPEWMLHVISGAITYPTLIFEVGFVFLVWNRLLRPLVLFTALLLHAGIALFMGLGGFACIMLTGVLAFVTPPSLRYVLESVFKGAGGMRFVFDRQHAAQLSAASLIKAADPWGQVALVESSDTHAGAPAGTLVLADGTTLRGAAAFRRLFVALRILWLAWPVAIWPFLAIGKEEMTPAAAR